MLSFFKNGHAASCGAPNTECSCEPWLYVLTGALAILAGAMQAMFGYWSSLALLSDALHALADGTADLFAAVVAVIVFRNRRKEHALRENGQRVISLLLAISAAWVMYEAISRAASGIHEVVPWILAVGGVGGACIDILRLHILRKAQETAPNGMRSGLIAHARADMHRSIIAATVGGMLLVGEFTVKAPWFELVISSLDLGLSTVLSMYMFYLARGIWRGEHAHVHAHKKNGGCGHHH